MDHRLTAPQKRIILNEGPLANWFADLGEKPGQKRLNKWRRSPQASGQEECRNCGRKYKTDFHETGGKTALKGLCKECQRQTEGSPERAEAGRRAQLEQLKSKIYGMVSKAYKISELEFERLWDSLAQKHSEAWGNEFNAGGHYLLEPDNQWDKIGYEKGRQANWDPKKIYGYIYQALELRKTNPENYRHRYGIGK